MTTEATFDLYSRRDERGQMHLLDAKLMLGDGSTIVFEQGVATGVPASRARLLRHRKDLMIVPTDQEEAFTVPDEPELEPRDPGDTSPVEGFEPPAPPEMSEAEKAAQIEAARQHLAQEGVNPDGDPGEDDAKVVVPDGFALETEDGQPRCLAAKGDGTQCANAAVADHACGLAPHKEKVATAQAA